MGGSYSETVTRLEETLRELECEFLYLINDISTDEDAGAPASPPVEQLELARQCLSTAADVLRRDDAASPR